MDSEKQAIMAKPESEAGLRSSDWLAADRALEKADAAELHDLYCRKVIECDRVGQALETIAKHYAGKSDAPRYMPSENALGAMERVALAAIELAKAVAGKGG